MRHRTLRTHAVTAVLAAVALVAAPSGSVASAGGGFLTSKRPQLKALAPGVTVTPILTTGDVIGSGRRAYQMSGIPDGIGAYSSSPTTIEVFVNHELDGDPASSRVSHLTLDNAGAVTDASYPIDGSERYHDFCSSTLETLSGTPWYFTGEESRSPEHGGVAIALNTVNDRVIEMPHLGFYLHENVVPVQGLDKAMIVSTEDGRPSLSQVFAYTADTFDDAIHGRGTLRVFAANNRLDGNPSPDDIREGESIRGHWASLPDRAARTFKGLERAAQRNNAFDFVRPEDITTDPNDPGVLYMADTGAADRENLRGSIYKFVTDPSDLGRVTLTRVIDADRFRDKHDLFNPDNVGINNTTLMINEDRNYAKSGYNKVYAYDLVSGTLTAVARTTPTDIAKQRDGGPGAWESSGIVDASAFFGPNSFFVDVQAGDVKVSQPGPSLRVDSAEGEGGQFLLLQLP